MDTDRELLEAAAKAAGLTLGAWRDDYGAFMYRGVEPGKSWWNPLTDDGDALRLAVKLKLEVSWWRSAVLVETDDQKASSGIVDFCSDPYAATRRAIVRAAAELGRSKNYD